MQGRQSLSPRPDYMVRPCHKTQQTPQTSYYILFYLWVFCLHICVCTVCVPGAVETWRVFQVLWNWSYRWLLSHHVGDGNQTLILCKSNKHSKLPSHQSHFVFKCACVCPHVCMYTHREVSAMVKIGGCVHMSHCCGGRREPDLEQCWGAHAGGSSARAVPTVTCGTIFPSEVYCLSVVLGS